MSALHAAFLLGQVEEAEAGLNGPEQRRRLDRLHHDRGNLHAALTWARGEGGPLEVRLAGALGRYWQLSGQYAEGCRRRCPEWTAAPRRPYWPRR